MEFRPIFSAMLRNKTAPLLVALQVAISLAILVNALHVVNLRLADARRPSGISDESTVFHIDARPILNFDPAHRLALKKASLPALRAIPGVRSVAISNQMPMSRNGQTTGVAVSRKQTQNSAGVSFYTSAGGMVETLGLRLLEGRDFLPQEVIETGEKKDENSQQRLHAIITRPLAQLLFPDSASVVGKVFYLGMGEQADAHPQAGDQNIFTDKVAHNVDLSGPQRAADA
ncbi:MAG: hypothetical protein RL748_3640, partial [Pseudomonadota bacterium]